MEKKEAYETFKILKVIPLLPCINVIILSILCIIDCPSFLQNSGKEQGQRNSWKLPGLAACISQPAMLMQDVISSRVDSSRYLFDSKFKTLIPYIFTRQSNVVTVIKLWERVSW